mgnify:CR=1 FL=1
MFDEYITLLTKKKQDVEPYQIRMDLANKASRMLDKVENVQIIDSLVVDKDDFLISLYLKRGKRYVDHLPRFLPDKRSGQLIGIHEPEGG